MLRHYCMLVLLCAFSTSLLIEAQPEKSGKKQVKTAGKKSGDRVTIKGTVHFYGDRYILKGTEKSDGKWFVLLENDVLQKLVKKSKDSSLVFAVEGNAYNFNQNRYLFLKKFAKENSKASEEGSESSRKSKKNKKSDKKSDKSKKSKDADDDDDSDQDND